MRTNATFRYKPVSQGGVDDDGHVMPGTSTNWVDGIECYVEIHIPAKQIIGVDGQVFNYNYSVFIPKFFEGSFSVTGEMELTYDESGEEEIITIKGVDHLNRKYIEVWA